MGSINSMTSWIVGQFPTSTCWWAPMVPVLPDSKGLSCWIPSVENINTYEYGVYGGGTIEFNQRLRVAGLCAWTNTRTSSTWSLRQHPWSTILHRYRPAFSFSSAIRNPTLTNQYLFYNVGRAILIGNLDGFQDRVTVESPAGLVTIPAI